MNCFLCPKGQFNQIGFLVVFQMLFFGIGCGGEKGLEKRSAGDKVNEKNKAECGQLSKRSRQCVGVLVPIAQKRAQSMFEAALKKVPASKQKALRKGMQQALHKQKERLEETLKVALKTPFMNWCLRAAGDPNQQKLLKRALLCLKKPDCQTYGVCLDAVMKSVEKDFYGGFLTPRLSPKASGTQDATSHGSKEPPVVEGDGGIENGSLSDGEKKEPNDAKTRPSVQVNKTEAR